MVSTSINVIIVGRPFMWCHWIDNLPTFSSSTHICGAIGFQLLFLYCVNAGVGTTDSALDEDGVLDIDTTISLETTWHAMEDLVSMRLVHSIGVR